MVEVFGLRVEKWKEFPSPCGVKVVGNSATSVISTSRHWVSVPLRGKGSRKCNGWDEPRETQEWCVSVPLRGKGSRK